MGSAPLVDYTVALVEGVLGSDSSCEGVSCGHLSRPGDRMPETEEQSRQTASPTAQQRPSPSREQLQATTKPIVVDEALSDAVRIVESPPDVSRGDQPTVSSVVEPRTETDEEILQRIGKLHSRLEKMGR